MSAAPFISIVDDDDSLRNSLNNLIRSVGFRAQGFPSAEAFLNSSELHDTACLILDVRMPLLLGTEFAAGVKKEDPAAKIILISAFADDALQPGGLSMPGMSGLDLQRQLVATNSPIPIVFITSHGDDDAQARALEAGAVAFLYKPFREEALLKAIDSALNHK